MGTRWMAGVVPLLVLASSGPAAAAVAIDGAWEGSMAVVGQADRAVSASLARAGKRVSGTLAIDAGTGVATLPVHGRGAGARLVLRGASDAMRVRWRGRLGAETQAWSGPIVVKTPAGKERGVLTLARAGDVFSEACGAFAYFTDTVMPTVVQPVCAACHVAGGAATAARFRVTPGDPVATMLSALALVSAADPALSRILQKPRDEVAHGGGVQVVAGSAEDQVLVHWVELVVSPACGGGDPGGPRTPAELYADECASCHGADARGTPGRPDIHCNRSIHDVVRAGRPGDVEDMPAFPDLSEDDVAAIQGHLLGLCPTDAVTGAELYAGNCAGCHGADAAGATGPSVRCATRVADAVRTGRAAAMPIFAVATMPDVEVERLLDHLDGLCTGAGRPAADLYAGNCSTCHGPTAGGGRSALGVRGPDIQCTGLGDYLEKVRKGDDEMPAFPSLDDADVGAIRAWVFAGFCVE